MEINTPVERDSALPHIGFLGLGAMGGPMARNLLKAGYPLTCYDPKPEQLEACVAVGCDAAASADEAVSRADIILTSLPSSKVFIQVAENTLLPNARPGHVFIDMGTTEAPETRRLAAAFAREGASLIDAPVSGGSQGSEAGTLHIFVGGDESVARKCWPALLVLGNPDHVVYCGPSGSGQVVKAVNQLAMGLVSAAYLECVAFGVRGGVDPRALRQAVGGSDGWRRTFAHFAQKAVDGTADDVLIKFPELGYFLREAQEQGFRAPLTEALLAFCEPGPRDWVDNMGRPRVSYWHQLINWKVEDA